MILKNNFFKKISRISTKIHLSKKFSFQILKMTRDEAANKKREKKSLAPEIMSDSSSEEEEEEEDTNEEGRGESFT